MFRVLDIFSGIGGFSLGLERTGGFQTVAFCEIDPFCRKVLAKHWPGVFIHDDIRTLTRETLCKGYAENALLNQLCKETGGSSASVKSAITRIKRHAEQRTPRDTTSGPLSVEEALSNIMGESASVAESESTRSWQLIMRLITETTNGPSTRELCGNSLSSEDFLTTIRFFVTTATWQKPSTVPAHIREMVSRHDDGARLAADGIAVDVICGGFPCQDISRAGTGAGLAGERSGLWREYARLIGEIRPKFVIVENVAALLDGAMGTVCGDLAKLRYDAEWSTVSACALGAPHVRQRVFIVAYPDSLHGRKGLRDTAPQSNGPLQEIYCLESARAGARARMENPSSLYGGANGVSDGMDRNHAVGNSIYWPIPELIGRAILQSEAA